MTLFVCVHESRHNFVFWGGDSFSAVDSFKKFIRPAFSRYLPFRQLFVCVLNLKRYRLGLINSKN